MLHETIRNDDFQHNSVSIFNVCYTGQFLTQCAREIRLQQTCYTERFLAKRGQRIGFWDSVAQTIENRHVTRNNLNKIRAGFGVARF